MKTASSYKLPAKPLTRRLHPAQKPNPLTLFAIEILFLKKDHQAKPRRANVAMLLEFDS
jgi:hypothetical protein